MRIVLSLALLGASLAACDAPLEDEEALAVEESALVGPPRWGNIPILVPSLELHVCDEADAGTDDYVTAHFHVGGLLRSFTLDRVGNDFERNGTYTYHLPTLGGTKAQLKDLEAISIEKTGRDGLCLDRVALRMHGVKVWEYTSTERHDDITFANPELGGQGTIWLDATGDGGNGNKVRFSDVQVHYDTVLFHGPTYVEITTCDQEDAGTDDTVRLSWTHDGIVEPFQKLDTPEHDDFERGNVKRYFIATYEAVEKVGRIRLEKDGTDGWCISQVKLQVFRPSPGLPDFHTLTTDSADRWLDGDGTGWVGVDTTVNDVVDINVGPTAGNIGRVLGKSDRAVSVDQGFVATPNGNHPSCRPPERISRATFEGVFQTLMAARLRSKGYQWDDNTTFEIGSFGNDLNVNVLFRGGRVVGVFRVLFTCPGGTFGMHADSMVIAGDPDDSFARAMTELFDGWDMTPWLTQLAPLHACPTVTVESDRDVRLDWPAIAPVNQLCRVDSSAW